MAITTNLTSSLNIYSVLYNSFIFVGTILAIVSMFIRGNSGSIVTITAYSCMAAGLLLVLGILFSSLSGRVKTATDLLQAIQLNIGPFLIMAITIVYLLLINIVHRERIADEKVSNSYYLFSIFSVILIAIQMSLALNAMSKQQFKDSGTLPLMTSNFIYLIGAINVIMSLTIGTILKYFVTDG